MVKYTLIIEYLSKGNNFSQVATLCGCSRTTVILQNRPNQKLFAVLTGQTIADDEDEDKEDELNFNRDNDKNAPAIELGNDLKLHPDYFQFIIVDECHRSIYGKWKSVLDYFRKKTAITEKTRINNQSNIVTVLDRVD